LRRRKGTDLSGGVQAQVAHRLAPIPVTGAAFKFPDGPAGRVFASP
jgi:hypothetical protein